MNWQEATTNTLDLWGKIRTSIGTAEPLDLLVEINALCDLCELANSEAAGNPERCRYCPAYEQFGGCREVSAHLSELVMEKDWGKLASEADEFIARLEQMEVPGLPAPTNLSPN